MDVATSRKVTTFTILSVFGIGMAKSIMVDNTMPPMRFFFATGFTAFGLGVASDISPVLAGSLSLLVFTVVLLEEGPPLFRHIQSRDIPTLPKPTYSGVEEIFVEAVPLEPDIPIDINGIDIREARPLVTDPSQLQIKPRVRRLPKRQFPPRKQRLRANP